ncbi:hypothetical protein CEXT_515621 [Caerostris extrusa]|uniref:Uncharacterized protein n=1 Tax=Caerostris extrusa TaxID=172846 RepID=A0AAV4NXT5_CAEEX|nr:hypothetical protein CEXT_515621 [Caerostris extrusa]
MVNDSRKWCLNRIYRIIKTTKRGGSKRRRISEENKNAVVGTGRQNSHAVGTAQLPIFHLSQNHCRDPSDPQLLNNGLASQRANNGNMRTITYLFDPSPYNKCIRSVTDRRESVLGSLTPYPLVGRR